MIGRSAPLDPNDPTKMYIGQPNVSAPRARFSGTGLTVQMANRVAGKQAYFNLSVDGEKQPKFAVQGTAAQPYVLAADLAAGEHTVWWTRRNEPIYYGGVSVLGVEVAGGALLDPPALPARRIEVFGASIEQGWCLDPGPADTLTADNQDATLDWTQVAADLLGAQLINTAISGAGMRWDIRGSTLCTIPKLWQRVDLSVSAPTWSPTRAPADVAMLDLVGNDWQGVGTNPATGLAGLSDPTFAALWQQSALAFITTLTQSYPGVAVYLMVTPGWDAAQQPVVEALLTDTAQKAQAASQAKVAVIAYPADSQATANCAGHPVPTVQQAMGALTAARLRADLGW